MMSAILMIFVVFLSPNNWNVHYLIPTQSQLEEKLQWPPSIPFLLNLMCSQVSLRYQFTMLNTLYFEKKFLVHFITTSPVEDETTSRSRALRKKSFCPAQLGVFLWYVYLPAGALSCFSAMFPYRSSNFNRFHRTLQVLLTEFFCFLQPPCSHFSLLFLRGPYGRGAGLAVRLNHQLSYREEPPLQWHCDCLCGQPWVCVRGAICFCWRASGGGGGLNRAGRVPLDWHVCHRILPVGWSWGPVVTSTVYFFCLHFVLQLIKWYQMGTNS